MEDSGRWVIPPHGNKRETDDESDEQMD